MGFMMTKIFRSTQIKTYSWDNAQVTLAGNKCDMEDERVVSNERGKQLAEQLGNYIKKLDGICEHLTNIYLKISTAYNFIFFRFDNF